MRFAHLPSRGLLALSGADAQAFLQGLISNDLNKLASGAAMYAAMLTPQGKFLHDFFLMRRGDALLLDGHRERLPDLLQRLQVYKLRAQVNITRLENEGVTAAWGKEGFRFQVSGFGAVADPRLPQLGHRLYGDAKAIAAWCAAQGWQETGEAEYDAMRLALGVPDGARDMIVDKSFLLELGFEDLHGVDFNKGCYVGQEVTARSKFRGQVRKHLYRVAAETELPAPGTPVMQGEAAVGELRSHAGAQGLAILRIEAVEKAAKEDAPLVAGGVRLTASLPGWARPPMAA